MKQKTAYCEINTELEPIELSLVVNGADRKATILEVLAATKLFEQNLKKNNSIDLTAIKDIKEEFVRNSKAVNVTFYEFATIIKKYDKEIDFNLGVSLHGDHPRDGYKYTSDFDVSRNGKKIKYCDLAKLNNWIF
jgi:hypothetical protein